MRTPLRFLAAFFPLLTLVTFLTTLQHQPYLNSLTTSPTLLNLATTNPAMASLHKDAENLLAAINIDLQDDRHNRPVSGPSRQFHLHIRLLSTQHHHLLPSLRRSLRSWLSNPSSALVPDLLRLVKRPIDLHFAYPDTGRPYASCAVVGNSGVLLRSELGDLIDGHDLVIRLNNARTAGYEQHVGFKTSLSFINSNVLHLCSRRSGCPCHPNGDFVPIVMYICQAAHFIDYVICNSTSTAPLIVTDPRLDLLCARIVKYYSMRQFVEKMGRRAEEWGEARDERVFHYSSGMQAVVLALGICDQLSLFGFGKSAGMKHHYHNNQKVELDLHDYEAEYAFYGDLVDRPEVIPFLKDYGFDFPRVVFYH